MDGRSDLEGRARRVDALVTDVQAIADPDARATAVAAIHALLDLEAGILARVLDLAGPQAAGALAADPAIGSMLLLHGLHPVPLEGRVRAALDRVRPYLASHGGGVEVLDIAVDGVVRLRLEGSCHGCPSSTATLRTAIEQALEESAPDVTRLDVEGVVEPPARPAGFVPLASIDRPAPRAAWQPVVGLAELVPGAVAAHDVGGTRLAFCVADGERYAYVDRCPACEAGLGAAAVEGGALACPACGARYDVRLAGRSLDGASLHLEPVPLLAGDGGLRVAVPAGSGA